MYTLHTLIDNHNNGFLTSSLDYVTIFSIICGILVIISRNPIISILYLIGLFLNISIYLIFIGLTFIGLSYLLVYIGAVSILFLFILMLIDVRVSELHSDPNNGLYLSIIIAFIFYINVGNSIPFSINTGGFFYESIYNIIDFEYESIMYVLSNSWDGSMSETHDIINIGNILYSNVSIWLIIASLVLLLAMVGAIIINIKRQALQ
jgi:NADH-ubiquinone oxidoreductase chain 6